MKQTPYILLLFIIFTGCNLRNENKDVLTENRVFHAKCSPNGTELFSYAHDLNLTLKLCNFFGASPIGDIHSKDSGIGVSGKLFGKLATNNNGSMCFAAFNLPYLSCYTLENEIMRERCSFYFDTTSFDIRNGNLLFSKDKAKGRTLDLKMDDLYIYILYSNRLLSKDSESLIETSMANNIHIFDYDGNAVASIKLDNYISSFDISHSKKKLLAIAYMPEQTLVEFDLPAEFWKELSM